MPNINANHAHISTWTYCDRGWVWNWKHSRLGCKRSKIDSPLAIIINLNLILTFHISSWISCFLEEPNIQPIQSRKQKIQPTIVFLSAFFFLHQTPSKTKKSEIILKSQMMKKQTFQMGNSQARGGEYYLRDNKYTKKQ